MVQLGKIRGLGLRDPGSNPGIPIYAVVNRMGLRTPKKLQIKFRATSREANQPSRSREDFHSNVEASSTERRKIN